MIVLLLLNGCNHTTEPETEYDGTKPSLILKQVDRKNDKATGSGLSFQ